MRNRDICDWLFTDTIIVALSGATAETVKLSVPIEYRVVAGSDCITPQVDNDILVIDGGTNDKEVTGG